MIEEGHENSAYDNILDGKYKHFLQILSLRIANDIHECLF